MRSATLAQSLPLGAGALSILLVWAAVSSLSAYPRADPRASASPAASPRVLSPVFARPVQFWSPQIRRWSQEEGLDPDLAATVMQIESCGNPQALSEAGALGLFQVMPLHFKPGENPADPQTNAHRGLAYLAMSLRGAHGDLTLALAAYNGGPQRLTQDRQSWPLETQRYVYWGTGIYEEARSGASSSARLQEWLKAGGSRLCQQAARALGLSRS